MSAPPPKLDPRTAQTIAQQVHHLLAQAPMQLQLKSDDTIGNALVKIFARYAELMIQRLNQVPDKNFLAFLDLLGASRLPPQPAHVPLTFFLAAGSTMAIVPKGTQVAAPPPPGEKDPVIFETARELVVTAVQLASVFVRDPEGDRYADYSLITDPTASLEVPIFRGDRPIPHIFYIGQGALFDLPDVSRDSPQLQALTLTINLEKTLGDGGQLQWQVWNGDTWEDRGPADNPEGADNLARTLANRNAEVTFTPDFNDSEIKSVPVSRVESEESRWLRCFLKPNTPMTLAQAPQLGRVRTSELPRIRTIGFRLSIDPPPNNPAPLPIEAAFFNQLAIDLTKPFFPFGEKPKFGDTVYLANREAFSKRNAAITLQINLLDLADLGISATAESNNITLKLHWEYWDGTTWKLIGESTRAGEGTATTDYPSQFRDKTRAFTFRNHEQPSVSFTLPNKPLKPAIVNGVENYWIRVRIVAGDYGKEARYEERKPATTPPTYDLKPASFAPPVIRTLTVGYRVVFTAPTPDKILTYNDFAYKTIKGATNPTFATFSPFEPIQDKPTLYLGFVSERAFPNQPLSLFIQTTDFKYGETLVPISPTWSRRAGTPGSVVTHTVVLTNPEATEMTFTFGLAGILLDRPEVARPAPDPVPRPVWEVTGVPAQPVTLAGGASQTISIRVNIPSNIPLGRRDRGMLSITTTSPETFRSVTFETIAASELPASEQLQLVWEYWNGTQWTKLTVRDESENFTRSGLVEFLPPADIARREDFGLSPRYWVRVRWNSGDYAIEPRIKRILLNTTIAAQTITLRNEILGSSDGTENQIFQATRSPILEGQRLEVQEPERLSMEEWKALVAEEGEDAVLTEELESRERWVRWHEVPDFYGSTPRSRHYVLDRLAGRIYFGNGKNGLIPPIGVGNLRFTDYQTGGGTIGNQAQGAIVQLKTTIPYVDKVINPVAAIGGKDAESLELLRDRVPRQLRHRHRAVTPEDYEDLAMLASSDVARAKCVPLLNLLKNDGLDLQNPPTQPPKAPGEVSLIIVPRSTDAKPLPALDLVNRVQDFLEANSSPTVKISVVGPLYIRVDVTTEIALAALEGASVVKQAVEQTLSNFLHPLTGGLDRTGWAFGREPHLSDLYALIEAIPGVDYIRSLTVQPPPYPAGIRETERFLVYSGNHTINLFFENSS